MNDLRLARVAISNAPVAGDVASANGVISIKGIPPIPVAAWKKDVRVITAQAETKKVSNYAMSGNVVAGVRYVLRVSIDEREFGENFGTKTVAAVAPAILTGTQATDKHNLYHAFAYRFNRISRVNCKAYPVVTQTHAAGTFTVGATITGATSGAQGIVISSASGTANIGMFSTTNFANGESLTSSTGPGPFVASAVPTLGVGLRFLDEGDYYSEIGNQNGGQVHILPGQNVLGSDITVVTPAVYQFGTGAIMARSKPVWDNMSPNLISGRMNLAYAKEDFAVGTNYNLIIIGANLTNDNRSIINEQTGEEGSSQPLYGIWVNNAAAGYAAWLAALQAL